MSEAIDLFQHDIISISDLSADVLRHILSHAKTMKKNANSTLLADKLIATCFFEPSTRTRLSFESAALRLGAKVLGFSDPHSTSSGEKGESLQDAMRVISSYADLIILRHPHDGAARLAAEVSDKPIINAGDGANQHPTQTLVDLFTIEECQGRLNGLNIGFVGDLKYGRTVHSLVQALALFDCRFFFVSPQSLMIPDSMCEQLRRQSIKFSFHRELTEVLPRLDILYMTRLQKERFNPSEIHEFDQCILRQKDLKTAKSHLKILHPLPRVDELSTDVDDSPHAYYFQQAANAVAVRQALLHLVLSDKGAELR